MESSALLHDLCEVVERILRRFRLTVEDRHKPLYKYATFRVFRLMAGVEGGSARKGLDLRLYDAETMNDPLEGRYLLDLSTKCADEGSEAGLLHKLFLRAREHYDDREPKLTFISSFTRKKDDLDLWRNYCVGHGVCFGFMPPPAPDFYKVAYGKEEADGVLEELAWALKPIFKDNKDTTGKPDPALCARALAYLRQVLYLVKAEGHCAENEVRLIETRDNWSDVGIDKQDDPKTGSRLYVVKEGFVFREPDQEAEVMLGPLSDKYEFLQGAGLFLKEVLIRLHRNRLYDVAVTYSRHNLRE